MNCKSCVHQISEISPMKQVRLSCKRKHDHVWSECVVVDRQCRGSKGNVKIEGYMNISDEEAHQCILCPLTKSRPRDEAIEWI